MSIDAITAATEVEKLCLRTINPLTIEQALKAVLEHFSKGEVENEIFIHDYKL
ncbi:MAG: hypothetical protein LIR50_05860 [Bacillota bacterium]|nr:hypothetical protein [Bacillota bacterium]